MCSLTEKRQPSFRARASSSEVPENQWKTQQVPAGVPGPATPVSSSMSSTAPAAWIAWIEITRWGSGRAAIARAIRPNASSWIACVTAPRLPKSSPTSPMYGLVAASWETRSISAAPQCPSESHHGWRPTPTRTFGISERAFRANSASCGVTVVQKMAMLRFAAPRATSRAFVMRSRWQCISTRGNCRVPASIRALHQQRRSQACG